MTTPPKTPATPVDEVLQKGAVAPAQKVSVPVATSGNSMDGRNRSIEKQVGVKALIDITKGSV